MLLVECELSYEETVEIMGRSKERVSGIRKVYVDGGRLAMALAARIGSERITARLTRAPGPSRRVER